MAQEEVILKLSAEVGDMKKQLEEIQGGIKGIGEEQKTISKTSKGMTKALGGISKGFKGMGLAMKAAGIGLVLKLVDFLTEALGKNQKIADAVAVVFDTISVVMNEVTNVLVDVYENVTKSSERFDALGKVLSGVMTLALTPLKLAFFSLKLGIQNLVLAWEESPLGGKDQEKIAKLTMGILETKSAIFDIGEAAINAGKDIYKNVGEAITEIGSIAGEVIDGVKKISVEAAFEQAKTTKTLRNQALMAKAMLTGLVEENDRLSESQRQIRDNENATFAERIAANDQLKAILEKQRTDMLKLADIGIAAAQAEVDMLDNVENRVALQATLNEKKGVEAQITGFMSEQMTNAVGLEKERLEAVTQVGLELTGIRERELAEVALHYDEQIKLANKAGIDTIALEEQKAQAISAIKQAALNADLNAIGSQLSAASALQREGTMGWKATKLAETIISTYTGAQAAYASVVGIPIAGPVLAPIAAGIAVAAGLANINTIQNTQIAMARGGLVGGYGSGTSDSVNARLSKGETVINAKSTRMFKPLLSNINKAGGGVGFADGGTLDNGSGGITGGVMKAYVVADEMTTQQERVAKIRRKATI